MISLGTEIEGAVAEGRNDPHVAKCPYCGAEYLPAELFEPRPFFGSPEVEKDGEGRIEYVGGEPMDAATDYVCDYCGKRFRAEMRFEVETAPDDFEVEHSSEVYGGRMGLPEDD